MLELSLVTWSFLPKEGCIYKECDAEDRCQCHAHHIRHPEVERIRVKHICGHEGEQKEPGGEVMIFHSEK